MGAVLPFFFSIYNKQYFKMSKFRSYFEKNSTIIKDNVSNNGQNPVTEIVYGTENQSYSRFIFKIDLSELQQKMLDGDLTLDNTQSHILKLTNTIALREDLLGGNIPGSIATRANSFTLRLFEIKQNWDEGTGFDFVINDAGSVDRPANWNKRTSSDSWQTPGAIVTGTTADTGTTSCTGSTTGVTRVVEVQTFPTGNENVYMDITTYINELLFSGCTSEGLGLAFTPDLEVQTTTQLNGVAFFTRHTHTFFEPFLETTIDDQIIDDRNFFYKNKDNELFLYSKIGTAFQDITVTGVTITDQNNTLISSIPASGVTKVKTGVYKIPLNVSDPHCDGEIYNDNWGIVFPDTRSRIVNQEFYLIPEDNYFNFNLSSPLNIDNFHFSFVGIKHREHIRRGDVRSIRVKTKRLYSQNDQLPLDVEYRLFVLQGGDVQIDVIPYTKVNRTSYGYEFSLDTSWLVPQQYNLELRLFSGEHYESKAPIVFTIVSDGPLTNNVMF